VLLDDPKKLVSAHVIELSDIFVRNFGTGERCRLKLNCVVPGGAAPA
jgi:hypothetical protein